MRAIPVLYQQGLGIALAKTNAIEAADAAARRGAYCRYARSTQKKILALWPKLRGKTKNSYAILFETAGEV